MGCAKIRSGWAIGAASLFVASLASAAPSKGDTGGKGGPGPESSTQSGAEGTASTPMEVDLSQTPFGGPSTLNPDVLRRPGEEQKSWEVSGTYELHRLLIQQDLAGNAVNKVFQVLYASVKYAFTDHDVLSFSGGATEGFLADQGETGVRATDLVLAYSHSFELPAKFRLRATGSLTGPISFYSQLASNITSPSLNLALSRRFGDLFVQATARGTYFWDRYTSSAAIGDGSTGATDGIGGGQPNPKWALGGSLSAEYDMPFHRPLSLGLVATDSYVWLYDVGAAPPSSPFPGAAQDPTWPGAQPMQQSYGGEVFVRYVMPDLAGFRTDLTLALANGDPSLGYPSVLHDGIVHPYLLYRDTAEVYFAMEGRY